MPPPGLPPEVTPRMKRFVARRFAFGILSILAATVIVFSLSRMAGDPLLLFADPMGYGITPEQTRQLAKRLGLDKPLIVQYFVWLGNTLKGDLGKTLRDRRPVRSVITGRIGATLQLALGAFIFATVVGIPLGVLSAVKRGTTLDYMGRGFALFGQALPVFWIGILGILIFSVRLDWLPSATRPVNVPFLTQVKHFVMPTIVLGWYPAAAYLRLTRSAMLDVLDSEYVKFARGKGVRPWGVVWKHAFRNALLQPLTLSALVVAGFIHGSVIVETVFAWPGMGRLAVTAVWDNDFPILVPTVLFFAVIYVVMNFLADVGYAYVDPRIRFQ